MLQRRCGQKSDKNLIKGIITHKKYNWLSNCPIKPHHQSWRKSVNRPFFCPKSHTWKSFDYFTLYTTIPLGKLKSGFLDLIMQCFNYKNAKGRYKYLALSGLHSYFVKEDTKEKYTTIFWSITLLSSLADKCSSRLLAYQWSQILLSINTIVLTGTCASSIHMNLRSKIHRTQVLFHLFLEFDNLSISLLCAATFHSSLHMVWSGAIFSK